MRPGLVHVGQAARPEVTQVVGQLAGRAGLAAGHDGPVGVVGDRVIVLTPGPGRILADLPVSLPQPRDQTATKELPEFVHLRAEVSRLVRSRTASSALPSAS